MTQGPSRALPARRTAAAHSANTRRPPRSRTPPLPHSHAVAVQILTAGGTIDKLYFDARSEYEVGEPQIGKILREAGVTVDYDVEVVLQKDSLDLTDADRRRLAERAARTGARQVLITHGTDTMVRTARTLEDALHSEGGAAPDKTVVLVGSLSPARFKSSDAVFNIGFATAAVQTLPPGVYLAMNGQVFRPGDVRKNHEANRFERPDAPEER
ncbi:MAG: asparaginase [Bacteroidetes bacterium QH_8_67_23]|nr:MAG: asparaginase [Bacteroidetes bacterium QH_8_67_23]